jgi:hypothetical protein
MQSINCTTVLLVILLVVLNGKAIATYIIWLRFKIRTSFKQMENEYINQANNRSRELRSKRASSLQG